MSMHVSLGLLEGFVREKVSQGEYGSNSEVIREGHQLLQQREALWQDTVRAKIEEGIASCIAGRTVPADQAWVELRAWREAQISKLPK
jgi:putative addiction module CopG family antidote